MPLESFAQPEVAVAAAATAVAASPSIRQVFRRSLVYGLAGVLVAYDKGSAAAQTVVKGVRKGLKTAAPAEPDAAPTVDVSQPSQAEPAPTAQPQN